MAKPRAKRMSAFRQGLKEWYEQFWPIRKYRHAKAKRYERKAVQLLFERRNKLVEGGMTSEESRALRGIIDHETKRNQKFEITNKAKALWIKIKGTPINNEEYLWGARQSETLRKAVKGLPIKDAKAAFDDAEQRIFSNTKEGEELRIVLYHAMLRHEKNIEKITSAEFGELVGRVAGLYIKRKRKLTEGK